MITLMVPSPLVNLLPNHGQLSNYGLRTVPLNSGAWADVAVEIRERLPMLAQRVLTDSDDIAAGFLLVVNDEVLPHGQTRVVLHDGDDICVITQIAGG